MGGDIRVSQGLCLHRAVHACLERDLNSRSQCFNCRDPRLEPHHLHTLHICICTKSVEVPYFLAPSSYTDVTGILISFTLSSLLRQAL
jgi:hypothetical protein